MSATDIPAFLAKLQRAHAARQRKLLGIDVAEVSGVDHPAHLREGWLIKKSARSDAADPLHPQHQDHPEHPADRHFLSQKESHTAEALHGARDLKPGEFKKLSDDATLGREECDCLSLTTSGSIAKAEREQYENRFEKSARYTAAEEAFLLGRDPE